MATTASEYYPYDAGTGANITEAQWRKMMGLTTSTGVVTGYLNELAVTGDSSGMQVKLATGGAWIYGAYGENSTSVQTISIAASHATLHRYDLIVARNNYTTNVVEWDVIQGTNAASPTVPTVTCDTTKYELALAYVYVAATVTTITAANVTDQRAFIPGNSSTANSGWRTYTPTLYNMTQGNGTISAKYEQRGKTVHLQFKFTLGTTSAMGTGPGFSLPVTAQSDSICSGQTFAIDTGNFSYPLSVGITTTTTSMSAINTAGTYAVNQAITSTVPFTWGNTDYISVVMSYQAA